MYSQVTIRSTGRVRWFDPKRGYGFIIPDDGGQEVFVRWNGINGEGYRNLNQGDAVSYDLVDTPKGPQAQNVTVRRW